MKKVLGLVVLWAAVLGGAALAWKTVFERPEPPPPPPTLRLSLDSFSGYAVFRSPAFKKRLAARGYDFEWVDDKADYKKRMTAIQDGSIPFAVFTIDALLQQTPRDGDPPASIVLVLDETRGADAVVVYPPPQGVVKDVNALNDPTARLVFAEGTPSEMLARVMRTQFDLKKLPGVKKDFLIPAKDAEDVLQRFIQGSPSDRTAYVLWEPYVQKARQAGAVVLVDSGDLAPGSIVDVLVVRTSLLKDHPEQVEALVQVYLETLHDVVGALDSLTDLVEADSVLINEKMTRAEAVQVARGIWWKNTLDNYAHFRLVSPQDTHGLQPVGEMVKNITQVLDQTRQPGEASVALSRPDRLVRRDVLHKLYEQRPPFMIGKEVVTSRDALSPEEWEGLKEIGTIKLPVIQFTAAHPNELDEDLKAQLDEVPAALQRWPQAYLLIEGQTGKGGDAAANKVRNQERAEAVLHYLVDVKNMPASRLRAVAGNREGEARSVRLVAKRR